MKMRDLLEDIHVRDKNGLRDLQVVYEHEGKTYEVADFDILCGKLVLRTWPVPLAPSAPAR